MQKLIKIIFFIILITNTLFSQEIKYSDDPYSQRQSYGLFGGINFNQHSADFSGKDWEGFPNCCPGFENGLGLGYNFGLLYSLPLFENWDLNLRLIFIDYSALLSKEEPITLPKTDGTSYLGTFEHTVDASLSSAAFEPFFTYRSTDQLFIHLGLRTGIVLTKSFTQKEAITDPDWGVFVDSQSRERNKRSGDIPNASALDLSLIAGLSYSLPLSNSYEWFLEPELYYHYGLLPVVSGLSWNATSLSGGLAIKYSPRKKIIPILPPKKAPLPAIPPPPLPPKFEAFITAVSLEEDGSESPVSKIRIDEYEYRKIHPLLNYIFFEENNDEIPDKYKKLSDIEKQVFTPNNLANLKTMDVYYLILNIIGYRLQKFPNITVKLIGCNSDKGPEANNMDLSKKRAENVKNFLVKEWNISPDRISIEARNLPEVPSNPTRKEGDEENRRVEIKTEFNEILFEPLVIRDTLRTTNPPVIRFKPSVASDIGIKSWKVITYQGNKELKTFEGTGTPPTKLDLDLVKEEQYVPLLNEDFKYKLIITDNDNKTWESEVKSLKVEPYTIENKFLALIDGKEVDAREFDQYSLISFGFNKSDLTPEHIPIINIAKKRIMPNSIVGIIGHTDNIGDQNRNQKLSEERAFVTADALNVDRKYAKGVGSIDPLYSNNLPEGRFYNRTVYITIETKIVFE